MHERRRARLLTAMTEFGGVARTERLRDLGLSRRDIETAVGAGMLMRLRPRWVAVPEADRMLVEAARRGVVLTCVTQARRLGLWVHDERSVPHVGLTPGSRGGQDEHLRVHWARPAVARHPDLLEDPIENVLAIVASCEPYEQALATWDSALNQGLVTKEALARLRLKPAARRLLADAWPFADAGLETYLRPRLRFLRVPLYFQTWIAGHRVDALLGERLIVQVDGATHVGAQRTEDIRHDADLLLMGYHVIRVGYHQVMHDWQSVQDTIMRAVAQGLHRRR